jgi:chromosome segregation ATPase
MIEEVCRGRAEPTPKYDELLNSIQTMESRITALESTIQDLQTKTTVSETVHVNRIGNESPQMWIKPMKDLEIHLPKAPVKVPEVEAEVEEVEAEVEEVEAEVEEVEAEVEEVEAEVEEVEAEVEEVEEEVVEVEAEVVEVEEEAEEEEEEAEEEEEEEEAEEVEEFTFKNKKYYKDSANNVYGVDADGDLVSEAIGVWDVQRQRVLFKRT